MFLSTPAAASPTDDGPTDGDGDGAPADLFLTESDPTALSSGGSPLGCCGLSGYSVELDTDSSGSYSDPNINHFSVNDTDSFSSYGYSTSVPTARQRHAVRDRRGA